MRDIPCQDRAVIKPPLNDKQNAFCREYVVDFNATQAAIRAGYSPKTAGSIGHDLLKKAEIQAQVQELRAASAKRLDIEADDVLRMWWETATADPNELCQHRIGACRYCWGENHLFQWKTLREYQDAHDAWAAKGEKTREREPSPEGGFGYRRNTKPCETCPECCGDGVGYIVFTDTTRLSPQARLLYNGVKVSQSGTEILMADRQKAIEHVARRIGLMKEAVTHDVSPALAAFLEGMKRGGSSAPLAPIVPPVTDLDEDEDEE